MLGRGRCQLKCSPSLWRWKARTSISVLAVAVSCVIAALGELPGWIRNIEAKSPLELVFFRWMALPGGPVLFRRPPSETQPALSGLIQAEPHHAELYALRAREDEQQLDFEAAETDWKNYASESRNSKSSQLALADFYQRRLRSSDEIHALTLIANAQPDAHDQLTPSSEQTSWKAFVRIFAIIQSQALPKSVSIDQYRAWIARYPQ